MAEQMQASVRKSVGSSGTLPSQTEGNGTHAIRKGLTIPRRWTRAGISPFDEVSWELRTASIGNEKGEVVFEQKDVDVPAF